MYNKFEKKTNKLYNANSVNGAATATWCEDTGTATGSPAKGTTRTEGVTDVNWKNSGVIGTGYAAAPITAGNNSFVKWQFLKFTGTYNQILNGLFAHTSGVCGTDVTLHGPGACTNGASRPLYTTPDATTNNTACPTTITSAISIGSGVAVAFGPTGPEDASKGTSHDYTTNPVGYSNYLPTQLRTGGTAVAGDIAALTLTCQFDEN